MKSIIKYTVMFILLFCININLFSQAEENWIELTSYDRLEGEWEGNAISRVRNNDFDMRFESKLNISLIFNYKKGNKNVSSIVKFDFTDFLTDLEKIKEMKKHGFTKENIWEIFKNTLKDEFITFEHYSIIVRNTELAVEYFASDSRGKFLIDKNKDILLLIYYEPSFVLGIGDSGFTEMIFKKIK
jgi:hypothetical protein